MAILGSEKALKILKGELTYNKQNIEAACTQDSRMQLHTLAANKKEDLKYFDTYINEVKRIVSPEKLEVFKHLQSIPFETTEILEESYRHVEKIFETEDKKLTVKFQNNDGLEEDFFNYLKKIKDWDFWRNDGMELFKSYINSFIVVDYPSQDYYLQNNLEIPSRVEPYYYAVEVDCVKAVEYNKNDSSKIEFIAFKDKKNYRQYNVFDSSFIYIYKKDDKGNYNLESIVEHGFSCCPVTDFYHKKFSKDNPVQKIGLATKLISELEWLSIRKTMCKHVELYSGFPITASYEEECNYQDEQGNQCDNGKIHYQVRKGVNSDEYVTTVKDCPACSTGNNLGAGTHKIAPARADKDDPDLLEALKFIQIPVDQIERLEKSIEKQIRFIKKHMIGDSFEANKEAINEMQVQGGFEERKSVLDQVRRNFEKTHGFVLERMAEIRYPNEFQKIYLSYGTKYFLFSAEELSQRYISYKEKGFPEYLLEETKDEIIETKYKTDKSSKMRNYLISKIVPYPHLTVESIQTLNQINPDLLDETKLRIRFNIFDYLSQFEQEFTRIEMFLPDQEINERLEFIKSKLNDYARQQQTTED